MKFLACLIAVVSVLLGGCSASSGLARTASISSDVELYTWTRQGLVFGRRIQIDCRTGGPVATKLLKVYLLKGEGVDQVILPISLLPDTPELLQQGASCYTEDFRSESQKVKIRICLGDQCRDQQ